MDRSRLPIMLVGWGIGVLLGGPVLWLVAGRADVAEYLMIAGVVLVAVGASSLVRRKSTGGRRDGGGAA